MKTGKSLCVIVGLAALVFHAHGQIDIEAVKKAHALSSQGGDVDIRKIAETMSGNTNLFTTRPEGRSATSSSVSQLDGVVDEDMYTLGAGDELTIYLWEADGKEIVAVVSPEGSIILPSLGKEIDINGLTLAQGKEKLRQALRGIYNEGRMSIVLSGIRSSGAHIVGDVTYPGLYAVNGATRVSDLINLAGGFREASDVRIRGIEVVNNEYPTVYADMARFYRSNVIEANPYLREGDRVFVRRRKNIISVFGEVNYAGTYDYVAGDKLATALSAAGGVTRNADSSRIIVTRFVNDVDSLEHFILSIDEADTFSLIRDDRAMVCRVPNYRIHRKVKVEGEVRHPGVYPIRKDQTRILDVLEMAGGLTPDAFLRGSSLVRRKFASQDDRDVTRLINTPVEGMSPDERAYLKTKLTETDGMSSINFDDLYNDKGKDKANVILRDGDSIWIAHNMLSVRVMGAVVSPGLVGYRGKDASASDYIKLAGGYKQRARKRSTVVIKAGTSIWLSPRRVERIEPGDAVFVAEREYVNSLEVLRVFGTIAGIILTIVTVGNYLAN